MKTSQKKLSVGVLASGSGTDLQSIIDASEKEMIDAEVVVVISDKKDAFALTEQKRIISLVFLSTQKEKIVLLMRAKSMRFSTRHQVELVVGAGYMRLLSPVICEKMAS